MVIIQNHDPRADIWNLSNIWAGQTILIPRPVQPAPNENEATQIVDEVISDTD